MNFFESIIHALSGTMETPTNYGWFHLLCLALVIGLTITICVLFKNAKSKTFRIIIGVSWAILFLFEIYKQIEFSFDYANGVSSWDYQWYAFPFQFCSTPLYVLPFVAFLPEGKVRDCFMSYVSSFVLFAGICVMLYPNDVFISTIGINIQTMIHHGLQVVLGIYVFVYNRKRMNVKYFLQGIIIFVGLILIALIMNVTLIHAAAGETFNMFYISPFFPCTLPVLSMIYPIVPYVAFLLIYIFGFALAAFIVFMIMYGIYKLCIKLGNKKHEQKS